MEKEGSKFLTENTIAVVSSICSFMPSSKPITGFIFAFDGQTSMNRYYEENTKKNPEDNWHYRDRSYCCRISYPGSF